MLVPGHCKTYAHSQNLLRFCSFFNVNTHGVLPLKTLPDKRYRGILRNSTQIENCGTSILSQIRFQSRGSEKFLRVRRECGGTICEAQGAFGAIGPADSGSSEPTQCTGARVKTLLTFEWRNFECRKFRQTASWDDIFVTFWSPVHWFTIERLVDFVTKLLEKSVFSHFFEQFFVLSTRIRCNGAHFSSSFWDH